VAEPKDYDEYLKRFFQNNKIEGFGLDVTMRMPCPFCAAVDFMVYAVLNAEDAMTRGATCKECNRGARAIFKRMGGSVSFELAQTEGREQPAWLEPKMRRLIGSAGRMNALTRLLLRFARPYHKGHLLHADGTPYMRRFGLFETRWLSARVHHIATADWDRDMHDHPWNFVSVVLAGGYTEDRPPCRHKPQWIDGDELRTASRRSAPSVAFRRATDRHVISSVDPETWTLFIYGPILQWWGFLHPRRKNLLARLCVGSHSAGD
jgi:hypothetical protein